MKGILIKKTDTVKVTVYVSLTDKDTVVASHVKEALEEVKGKEKGTYSFDAVFRKPQYRDDVEILSNSLKSDGVNFEFKPAAVKYLRLGQLIKSWTLIDDDGNPVPADNENISSLAPEVANALVAGLDEELS